MANLEKIVYLTEAQKNELFTYGSITSNGRTITYSANDLYVTPDSSVERIQLNGNTLTPNSGTINLGTILTDDGDYVINSMIAPTEETSTASQLYNIDDYFIYNHQLYKATSVIATGTTISPDTNCVAVPVISCITEKVTGPSSATNNAVAIFDGTTGKIIKDSGYTIAASVPSGAIFTDTTYESKAAASGGTAVSLVTTGEKYTWNNKYSKPSGGIPASDLAETYLTSFTETDPTVPAWAKQSTKPTYTAQEVGALPSDTQIPTKVSDLTNDSGYLTAESDPTVPSWAKASSKPSYTASEVGALPANTTYVSTVNGSSGAVTITIPTKVSDLTDDSGHYTKPSGGIPASDIASGVIPDVSGKVDKVTSAINGNFAALDSNGNLVDSGHKHSDYLTSHQDISGKLNAPATAGTSGQVLTSDGNGGQTWESPQAASLNLDDSYDTWGEVWTVIDGIGVGTTIPFKFTGTPMGLITNSTRTSAAMGTITKYDATSIHMIYKTTNNQLFAGKATNLDSTGASITYSEIDYSDTLPTVTSTDNGSFLRVVNGAWAVAAVSEANGESF